MAGPLDVGAVVVTYRLNQDKSSFAAYKAAMADVIAQASAAEKAATINYTISQKGGKRLTDFTSELKAATTQVEKATAAFADAKFRWSFQRKDAKNSPSLTTFTKQLESVTPALRDAKAAFRSGTSFRYSFSGSGRSESNLNEFAKKLQAATAAALEAKPVIDGLVLSPEINETAVAALKAALADIKREAIATSRALGAIGLGAIGTGAPSNAPTTRSSRAGSKERERLARAQAEALAAFNHQYRQGAWAFGAENLSLRTPSMPPAPASIRDRKISRQTPHFETFGRQLQGVPNRDVQRMWDKEAAAAMRAAAAADDAGRRIARASTKAMDMSLPAHIRSLGPMLDTTSRGMRQLASETVKASDAWKKSVFGSQFGGQVKDEFQKVAAAAESTRRIVERPMAPRADMSRFDRLSMAMDKFQTIAFRFSRDIQAPARFGARMFGIGGAAIGAPLIAAGAAAARFEDELIKVETISGATARQMENLRTSALQLATEGRRSATELAQAQGELIRGGMSAADVYGGGLKTALSLSTVGQLEMADAALATANAMNLFGISGKNSAKIANMFAGAANKTTAGVADFTMALSQGGSAAKLVGMDMESTMAILMSLAEIGVKNSDAGTSFKSALVQATGSLSPRAKRIMDGLGLSLYKANGQIKNAVELTASLEEAMAGLSEQEKITALTQIFGSDGFRTAIAMLEVGTKRMREFMNVGNEVNSDKQAKKMNRGILAQLENLKATVGAIAIEAFRPLEPELGKLIRGLKKTLLNLQPAINSFVKDIAQIFSGEGDLESKWDQFWQRIVKTGIPQKIIDLFAKGIVLLIQKTFQTMWDLFWSGPALTKLLIGGAFATKFMPALFAMGGLINRGMKQVVKMFRPLRLPLEVVPTLATGAGAAGAAGGAGAAMTGVGFIDDMTAARGPGRGRGGRLGRFAKGSAIAGSRVAAAGLISGTSYVAGGLASEATGSDFLGDLLFYGGTGAALGGQLGAFLGPAGALAGAATGALAGGLAAGLKAWFSSPSTDEIIKQFGERFGKNLEQRTRTALERAAKQAADAADKAQKPVLPWMNPNWKPTSRSQGADIAFGREIYKASLELFRKSTKEENVNTLVSRVRKGMYSDAVDKAGDPTRVRRAAVERTLSFVAEQERANKMAKGSYDRAVKQFSTDPKLKAVIASLGLQSIDAALKLGQVNKRLETMETRARRVKNEFRLTTEVVGLTAANAVIRMDALLVELQRKLPKMDPDDRARAERVIQNERKSVTQLPPAASGATIAGAPGASLPVRVHSDEVIMNRDQIDMVGRDRIMSVLSATGAASLRAGGRYAKGGVPAGVSKRAQEAGIADDLHTAGAKKKQQAATPPSQAPGTDKFNDRMQDLQIELIKAQRTKQPDRALKIKDTREDDKRVLKKMLAVVRQRVKELESHLKSKKYGSKTWQRLIKPAYGSALTEQGQLEEQIREIAAIKPDAKKELDEVKAEELLPSEKAVESEEQRYKRELYGTSDITEKKRKELEKDHEKRLIPLLERAYNDIMAAWNKAKGKAKDAIWQRAESIGDELTRIRLSTRTPEKEFTVSPAFQFSEARAELFREFGSNSRPMPVGGQFAGAQAGMAGSGGGARGGTMVTQNITIAQPPPDPHAFSRSLAFEIRGAL